jgi:hypothetical protein
MYTDLPGAPITTIVYRGNAPLIRPAVRLKYSPHPLKPAGVVTNLTTSHLKNVTLPAPVPQAQVSEAKGLDRSNTRLFGHFVPSLAWPPGQAE